VLGDIVSEAASRYGDRSAYVTAAGHQLSYAQLDKISSEVAVGLSARGVQQRSVVALLLPSTIEYVVLYVALAKLGAVTAGVNSRFTVTEQQAVIDRIQPDLTLSSADVALDATNQVTVEVVDEPSEILRSLRSIGNVASLASDDSRPVCICFTSGSTGIPKGAWYEEHQLQTISDLDTGGAWGNGGPMIASTAFAHVGFMTKMPWMIASGATMYLQDRWRAATTLRLIHDFKMRSVSAVAPQIALMLQQSNFADFDFSAVAAIVAGGAASPPALVREARERFGAPYSIRYSSTESGGIGLGTALDADDEEALHTIGRPRPGAEAEVRGPDLEVLGAGEVGELWLRTATAMSGYWNDPQETAETLVDGWLRTGDLAMVDEGGLFRLAGRVKEMFIRGGYNVYPMEVESVLTDVPNVREIAIVPRPDPIMGEIGVAVVVANGDPPDLAALRSHAEEHLAHYKLPEAIRIVERLPRNSSQKIDRRALAANEIDPD
jgi:acyl-CoA synthetase (AMP-forming)/AMP-acid ligase II